LKIQNGLPSLHPREILLSSKEKKMAVNNATNSHILGTASQITATPDYGTVVVAIASNPILPGTGSVGLPKGNTAQQSGPSGAIRFNTQSVVFEGTVDGTTWLPFLTGGSTVSTVSGTPNRITVTGTTNVVIDIASNYAGQTSIDILGTVNVGEWNADTIEVLFGGTGSTSFVAYAPVIGGTTTTGPLLSADTGISNVGWVFTSTGSSSAPTWQASPGSVGEGARVWAIVNGAGTIIGDSFNVSSLTDVGAGNLRINFSITFATTFSGQVSVYYANFDYQPVFSTGGTLSSASLRNVSVNTGAFADPGAWMISIFGNV
jgi:hypothetical protein